MSREVKLLQNNHFTYLFVVLNENFTSLFRTIVELKRPVLKQVMAKNNNKKVSKLFRVHVSSPDCSLLSLSYKICRCM